MSMLMIPNIVVSRLLQGDSPLPAPGLAAPHLLGVGAQPPGQPGRLLAAGGPPHSLLPLHNNIHYSQYF